MGNSRKVPRLRLPEGKVLGFHHRGDVMRPHEPFGKAEDNTCDGCGCRCIEVRCELRCYRRARPAQKPVDDRVLHLFGSCILVGVREGELSTLPKTQWDWPTQPEDFDVAGIAKPRRIGEPKEGKAVHVEFDSSGEPHCLLCDEPSIEHL